MNEKDLSRDFNLFASLLANAYIKQKGLPTAEEVLAEEGKTCELGKLYVVHVQALQLMLIDELKLLGLDLAEEIQKHGEKFERGKLSEYENKIIVNRVVTLGLFTEQIKNIVDKKAA